MNTTQMRNQVKQNIDKLSPEKLIVIDEFLRDLLNDENEDATEELLKISFNLATSFCFVGDIGYDPDDNYNREYRFEDSKKEYGFQKN